ncbi:MAG: hypothetical protein AAFY78_21590 [Cyanobacteria bacterium J06648_16]
MQSSSRPSTDTRRQQASQPSANTTAPIPDTSLSPSDSNVMSLVYPDGRVMTVELQEQFS